MCQIYIYNSQLQNKDARELGFSLHHLCQIEGSKFFKMWVEHEHLNQPCTGALVSHPKSSLERRVFCAGLPARAGLSCCWPSLASSSLRTLGPQRISMEKCRCTKATSRGFTLKLETIPQVAGCTVVICFLQKTATHISSA